jgi:hypothetical protein
MDITVRFNSSIDTSAKSEPRIERDRPTITTAATTVSSREGCTTTVPGSSTSAQQNGKVAASSIGGSSTSGDEAEITANACARTQTRREGYIAALSVSAWIGIPREKGKVSTLSAAAGKRISRLDPNVSTIGNGRILSEDPEYQRRIETDWSGSCGVPQKQSCCKVFSATTSAIERDRSTGIGVF